MPTLPHLVTLSVIQLPPEAEDSLLGGIAGKNGHRAAPILRAVEHIRRIRGGSQSHLMRCSDGSYYVVKFQNNPQHRRVLVNELLGTKLAALLGLPTTATAIIEVSDDLVRLATDLYIETSLSGIRGWGRIPCQPGLQFGSRYPGDPHQLTVFDFLETGSNSTVAALFPNAEDERNDLLWNAIPDVVRSAWLIPTTR